MTNLYSIKKFLTRLELLLGFLLVTSVFCLIFTLAHKAIFDPDIWLHLKTGELIAQNKIIPSSDIFSFTIAGAPWIDHSWFFQLLSYSIYSRWQAEGLIFLECLIIISAFLVLFLIGYAIIRSHLEVSIFVAMAAYASVSRFNIRPEIFSLLFFALYLYILRLHIDKRVIWVLVFVQALWVNFHGYFFLGPLLVILFISAEFLRRRLKFLPVGYREEFALSDTTYRRLRQLFFFVILACLLNPRGLQGALYPLYVFKELLSGRIQVFSKHIQELQSTFNYAVSGDRFYYGMIIFCFSLLSLNFKRIKIIEILLVAFFFVFALSLRNMGFFVFVCSVVLFSYIGKALKKINKNILSQTAFRQTLYFLFRCTATIVLVIIFLSSIDNTLNKLYYDFDARQFRSQLAGIDYRNYPKKAVDFILENNIPLHMLNDFNSGAYLIGQAYPKRKVFIDGRTELYGPEFFKQYMDAMKGDEPGFEKIINNYKIDVVLLSMAMSSVPEIAGYLYKSPQWKLVFLDEAAVIFLKNVSGNQELIRRYGVDLSRYAVPRADLSKLRLKAVYPTPYIRLASLFNLFGEDELVISECKEALRIMPNCAKCFFLLGKVYLRKGMYQDALEDLRSAFMISGGDAEILLNLGICYSGLKETKLAIDALKKALSINARYAPAYYHLGCVYLSVKNESEAINVLNKAIRYKPEEAQYHFKLAEALFELGKKLKDKSYLLRSRLELSKALELSSRYQDKGLKKEIEDKLKEISECTPPAAGLIKISLAI